jgi:hypothetical protein
MSKSQKTIVETTDVVATDAPEKAKAVVHHNDKDESSVENTDMTLTDGKVAKSNDVEV